MTGKRPSHEALALGTLLSHRGWKNYQLAERYGVPDSRVSEWLHGRKDLDPGELEKLASRMGFRPEAVARALRLHRQLDELELPPLGESPREALARRREAYIAQAGEAQEDLVRKVAELLSFERRVEREREAAPALWRVLELHPPEKRWKLVQEREDLQNWAVLEIAAAKSEESAGDQPALALHLAELAAQIADQVKGRPDFVAQCRGWAWGHLANARRAMGKLNDAEEAFARSDEYWEEGTRVHPEVLDGGVLLSLKASLRFDQWRLAEALELLDLTLSRKPAGTLAASLWLKKALALGELGLFPEGLSALQEAEGFLEVGREPRLWYALWYNRSKLLRQVGRLAEAAAYLPDLKALGERLNRRGDILRRRWLEGLIASDLGQLQPAHEALSEVRAEFLAQKDSYKAALVTLDTARLLVTLGETLQVKALAQEMLPVFQSQGVHPAAREALEVFVQAAEQERVTGELIQKITEFLLEARHNQRLRFVAPG